MYLDRIAIPHVTLDETFSALSSFITKYEPEEYEKSMGNFSKINAATRKLFTEREVYEQGLVRPKYCYSAMLLSSIVMTED